MFAHLKRGDGVERAVRNLAVVLHPDLHAPLKAAFLDPGVDERLLFHGERDADDVDAVVLRGVQAE